jgi:hypothetical protein
MEALSEEIVQRKFKISELQKIQDTGNIRINKTN